VGLSGAEVAEAASGLDLARVVRVSRGRHAIVGDGSPGRGLMAETPQHILLVEDKPAHAQCVQEALGGAEGDGLQLTRARSLEACLSHLAADEVDVVLLDLNLPDSEGIETLGRVLEAGPDLPVIAISGVDDESVGLEAVRQGAQDYLVAGRIDSQRLRRAIRHAVERKRVELALRRAKAEVAGRKLKVRATTDELTGLWNRRQFTEMLEQEFHRVRRYQTSLSLLILDVDFFKAVNDTYGHEFGDRILLELASLLKSQTRPADVIARFGGEEFVILMPHVARDGAALCAERIRKEVARWRFTDGTRSVHVTVSIGVSSFGEGRGQSSRSLIRHADKALYAAKNDGRNCTKSWDPSCEGDAMGTTVCSDEMDELRRQVATLSLQYKEVFVQSMGSLVQALDARDPYTRSHSENVTRHAVGLADAMGLDPEEVAVIRRAAVVHDVGKIGVPDALLRKRGKLSDQEWDVMRNHVLMGVAILEPLRFLEREISIVRGHHERWDGGGYPDGINGRGIPSGARILAVADAFDAMTSDRVYRKAMDLDRAMVVLKEEAAHQFDPAVVEAMLRRLEQLKVAAGGQASTVISG